MEYWNMWDFFNNVGANIVAAIVVSVSAFIIAKFRRPIIFNLTRQVFPELKKSGLLMIHSSMQDSTKHIVSAVQRTHELRILSNKGTDWIGPDTAALSKAVSLRSVENLRVFILLLGSDAPWLSKWSTQRQRPLSVVKTELDSAHRMVESYIENQRNLRYGSGVRYHRDDPVWRLIITDDRVFVSSYANADQARDATVFEFEGPNYEIFLAYKRHFDFLWARRGVAKNAVKESFTVNTRFDSFELSSGAVVFSEIRSEKKILLIERHDRTFTLPKGHVEKSENLQETAIREVHEETNLPISSLQIVDELGWYPNPLLIGDRSKVFKLVYYYLIRCNDNELPVVNPDTSHRAANWHSQDQLRNVVYAYAHIEPAIHQAITILGWNDT
jgi:8-oxo-dGTP pyrophosphatase MutT (NUDIX family)